MVRCASFFCGVGGFDLAFQQAGGFCTVYANDISKHAAQVFEANFPLKVDSRDIRTVPASEIPDFDVMFGGFPCQPFSIAGRQQGEQDDKGRGTLFYELLRIIQAKRPRFIVLENVKNLLSKKFTGTLNSILQSLADLGYYVTYKVLCPLKYGNVPQHRERVFFVAFKNETDFNAFEWPCEIPLTATVADIIDFNGECDSRYYYKPPHKYFYLLERERERERAIFALNYDFSSNHARISNYLFTLTARSGTGGNNCLVTKTSHGIRKLTPREYFSGQGFPLSFVLPAMADGHLYVAAGNSVCVPVVQRIAVQIKKVLDYAPPANPKQLLLFP